MNCYPVMYIGTSLGILWPLLDVRKSGNLWKKLYIYYSLQI